MGRPIVSDSQEGFSGGLNLVSSEFNIKPNQFRRAENAILTQYGDVTRRLGTQKTSTLPIATITGSTSSAGPTGWYTRYGIDFAEFPREYLNTPMPTRTGALISVAAGGNVQAALNAAQPGDWIELEAGATWTGNYTVPLRAGSDTPGDNNVIVVTVANAATNLPFAAPVIGASQAALRGLTATNLAFFATLKTATTLPVLDLASGTKGWRFVGLHLTVDATVSTLTRVLRFGDGNPAQNTDAQVPKNIGLDRSYVHGHATLQMRRAVDFQVGRSFIVNSDISGVTSETIGDCQAMGVWNTNGVLKFTNNYFEASSESVIIGGADNAVGACGDVEYRYNYHSKPLTWKQDDPSYLGVPWEIKNAFEIKKVHRMLIEGNVFEHSWVAAQYGYAMLVKDEYFETVSGGHTSDVIMRFNVLRTSARGINMNSSFGYTMRRLVFADNFVDPTIGDAAWDPAGAQGSIIAVSDVTDCAIIHNTGFGKSWTISLEQGGTLDSDGYNHNLFIRDNIFFAASWGIKGGGQIAGTNSLNVFAPGWQCVGNVFIGMPAPVQLQYPTGNFYATNNGAVGFTDEPGGDYSLTPSSPYHLAATDGLDCGVDWATLLTTLAGTGSSGGSTTTVTPHPVLNGLCWRRAATHEYLVCAGGHLYSGGPYSIPFGWVDKGALGSSTTYPGMTAFRDGSAEVCYIADGVSLKKYVAGTLSAVASTPALIDLAVYNQRLYGVTGVDQDIHYSSLNNGDTCGVTSGTSGKAVVRTFSNQRLTGVLTLKSSLALFHVSGVSRFTGLTQDDIAIASGAQGISTDTGTIAPRSAIAVEGKGYFLSERGAFRITDTEVEALDGPTNPDPTVLATAALTADQFAQVDAVHDKVGRSIRWFIPGVGVYVYNYRLGAWSGPHTGAYLTAVTQSLFDGIDAEGRPVVFAGAADGFVRRVDAPGFYLDDVDVTGAGGDRYTMTVKCRRFFTTVPESEKAWRFAYLFADTRGSARAQISWQSATGSGVYTLPNIGVTSAFWGSMIWGAFIWNFDAALKPIRVPLSERGPYLDLTYSDDGSTGALLSRVSVEAFDYGRRG